ncbi:tetratricopeptide repeat protein [Streptomyces sp. NPDC048696]|uniref:tetratricopeptide repeat protein n=1 Tax=Streptomyces sp. NPDC048696 TaxID=3365585 RepID=UPI0037178050
MAAAKPSMQELIRRRRRAGFVGRRGELAVFRENFALPPDDERHRFVFHVHGAAGVGKTSLVRELEHTARERGAVTAYADEAVNSVPETLAAICAHFARQDRPLKALERLLATYRQRRYEAESAVPDGPPPPPSPGGRIAARAGLVGLGMVPGAGALAGGLDPDQLALGADRLRAALSARFGKQEDVQLVLDPLQVLTPVLVTELSRIAEDVPWITLFFDTYERTGPFLDTWLRDLITTERYGALPAQVVVVLAGQRRLDPVCWADSADLVAELPLDLFTEAEARQLLATKGVLDEEVVRDVLRLSGRLPVLVSTLAENPGDARAPGATAVDRFLKWEADPVRRAAALACALPRRIDEDMFRAAVDEDVFRGAVEADAAGLFGWLWSLPFVSDRGGRAQYHAVVRAAMLGVQRTGSPQRWSERHQRLAEAVAVRREAAAEELPVRRLWGQEQWRELRLEESYHLLCARPQAALARVLRDGVDACDAGPAVARRWARTLAEAGEDADAEPLRRWGADCLAALDDERAGTARMLGLLLSRGRLSPEGRACAHIARGRELRDAGSHREALAEFDQAIALDPERARAHYGRSVVRNALDGPAAALDDIARACELAPQDAYYIGYRGDLYRRLGRFEEALADLDRAILLDPGDAWAPASRGRTRHQMGLLEGALSDLNRALELNQDYLWALVRRAQVRHGLADTAGALADLDRAERLATDTAWVVGVRGDVLRTAGRHREAVAEYTRALAADAGYAWALGSRAMCLEELGRHDEALADYDRALELDPTYAWALIMRARLRSELGDAEGALADLDGAVALSPDDVYALTWRGRINRRLWRPERASADLDRAARIAPHAVSPLVERSFLRADLGDWTGELADLDSAVALSGPDDRGIRLLRGEAHRRAARYEAALADCRAAVEEEPEEAQAVAALGQVLRGLGRHEEAYEYANRAVLLSGESGWMWASLAATHLALSRPAEALAALDRAIELDPNVGWARGSRARVWLAAGLTEGGAGERAAGFMARGAAELERCLSLADGRAARAADPDTPEGIETLCTTHRAQGNHALAAALATRLPGERGAYHHAMASSRAGLASSPWAEAGDGVVAVCARGEWERADALVSELVGAATTGAAPAWEALMEAAEGLTELGLCEAVPPGELRDRADRVRTALRECPPTHPFP